jgi:DNA-directed RNA polymerase subunit RPC12/RpoP
MGFSKKELESLERRKVMSVFERYYGMRVYDKNLTHKKAIEFICNEYSLESITVKKCLAQAENLGFYFDFRKLEKKISKQVDKLFDIAKPYWMCGNGEGGCLFEIIENSMRDRGLLTYHCIDTRNKVSAESRVVKKEKIPSELRKSIWERDEYRCKHCGTHIDLTIDHIKPESKGGTLEMNNLQTLCRSCNSKKGSKYQP